MNNCVNKASESYKKILQICSRSFVNFHPEIFLVTLGHIWITRKIRRSTLRSSDRRKFFSKALMAIVAIIPIKMEFDFIEIVAFLSLFSVKYANEQVLLKIERFHSTDILLNRKCPLFPQVHSKNKSYQSNEILHFSINCSQFYLKIYEVFFRF